MRSVLQSSASDIHILIMYPFRDMIILSAGEFKGKLEKAALVLGKKLSIRLA